MWREEWGYSCVESTVINAAIPNKLLNLGNWLNRDISKILRNEVPEIGFNEIWMLGRVLIIQTI